MFEEFGYQRILKTKEDQFNYDLLKKYPLLNYMDIDGSFDALREPFYFALYWGVTEGIRLQKQSDFIAQTRDIYGDDEFWSDTEYFPRFIEYLVDELEFDTSNIISLLHKPWKWEHEYNLWRQGLPGGELMEKMKDLPGED